MLPELKIGQRNKKVLKKVKVNFNNFYLLYFFIELNSTSTSLEDKRLSIENVNYDKTPIAKLVATIQYEDITKCATMFITWRHGVTLAQCFYIERKDPKSKKKSFHLRDAKKFKVKFATTSKAAAGYIVNVVKVDIHPKYSPGKFEFDLGVVLVSLYFKNTIILFSYSNNCR